MVKPGRDNVRNVRAYTDKLLTRISPSNRPFATHTVQLRSNDGNADKSVYNETTSLLVLDQFLEGRPFTSATSQHLIDFVTYLREHYSDATTFKHVWALRRTYRELLNVKDLPPELDRALYVKPVKLKIVGRLISDQDFFDLLRSTQEYGQWLSTLPTVEKSQALLWALMDSGFRAEELLGLNVGDVVFEDHHGARITLRPEAPNLKTGPRTIYVSQCVGPLRAWLALHPAAHDGKAPLFNGFYDRTGYRRLQYGQLLGHVHLLGDKSGVNRRAGRDKRLSPHDFRHTCATRKAKSGWVESELRAYFGWSEESHMPSYYVHLALGDMRERVRRDAGVDANGYQVALANGNKEKALKELLKSILHEESAQAAQVRPPEPSTSPPPISPWLLG